MMKRTIVFGIWMSLLLLTNTLLAQQDKKGMKQMDVLQPTCTLKVGEKAYIDMEVHGSVGLWCKVSCADTNIAKQTTWAPAYKNPQKQGMTGNDAAIITNVFQAVKKGSTEIEVQKQYRGNVEATHKITLYVQ